MKATHGVMVLLSAWLVAGCTQQNMAQVFDKGNQFFGRVNYASDLSLRGPQNPTIAAKYQSSQPEFSTAAAVDRVETKVLDLPPPAPAQAAKPAISFSSTVAKAEPKPVQSAPIIQEPQRAMAYSQPTMKQQPVSASLTVDSPVKTTPPVVQAVASAKGANFVWPTEGNVISSFGPKPNGLVNDGINIAAADGQPIWAAADGEVAYAGNELKGYGNMMIIRHAGGYMTAYAHASDMLVQKGMKVKQGDLIGYVGKTGDVSVAQLHFGIRQGKSPINPETLLPRRMASAN